MIIYKEDKVHDFTRFAHVIRTQRKYIAFMSTDEFIKYVLSHTNQHMVVLK